MEFAVDWTSVLVAFLENVVPILLTALAGALYKYFKAKGAKEEMLALAKEALTILGKCVLNVNQTFVDALKAEGTFDEAAQAEARKRAEEMFKEMISEEMRLALETLYGSADKWLEAMREAAVWEAKKGVALA